MKGNRWPVFGVIAVLFVAVAVVAELIIFAAAAVGSAAALVVSVVLGVLTAPLAALPAAVLYFELRRLAAGRATPAAGPGLLEPDPHTRESADAQRAFGSSRTRSATGRATARRNRTGRR